MAVTLKPETISFLETVPTFPRFKDISDFAHYVDVPKEWYLFVSDICGSTKATEEGRYKDVNIVGASAVMAVLNAIKPHEAFYVFGGDGATFLCPPEEVDAVQQALLGARDLAKANFGFTLRVGMVPVWHLYAVKLELKIAKYQMSPHIVQAVMGGDGFAQAENWVKHPPFGENYEVTSEALTAPDTTGLECRWNPVKSKRGKMTSILVQSLSNDGEYAHKDYDEVIELVEGMVPREAPVFTPAQLSLSVNPNTYVKETKVRSFQQSLWNKATYWLWIFSVTTLFKFLWSSFLKKGGDKYRTELVENSDYRKFDGTLRMVLDLSEHQIKQLETLLQAKAARDEVVYGIHTSDSALLTCLIFNRSQGNHIHFVDGNDGGYSAAAKDFKKRLSERNEKVCSVKRRQSSSAA